MPPYWEVDSPPYCEVLRLRGHTRMPSMIGRPMNIPIPASF